MDWAKTVLLVSSCLAILGFLQTTKGVRADISSELRMTVEDNGGFKANVSAKTERRIPSQLENAIRQYFGSVGDMRASQESARQELRRLADTLMQEADDARALAEKIEREKPQRLKETMCCGKCDGVNDFGAEKKPGEETTARVFRWRCTRATFAFYVGFARDKGFTASDESNCRQHVMAERKPILFASHETWANAQNTAVKRFADFEADYGFDKDSEKNYDYLKGRTWGPYFSGVSESRLKSNFFGVLPCNNWYWQHDF